MTIETLTGWLNSRYYIAGVARALVYKRSSGEWGAEVFDDPPAYYPNHHLGYDYPSIVAAKRAVEADLRGGEAA